MTENEFKPDPSMVSHLDQQGAAFRDDAEAFEAKYGFKHECQCAEDYAAGKIGSAPNCYFTLTEDAMETCADLKSENRAWERIANEFSTLAEHLYKKLKEKTDGRV